MRTRTLCPRLSTLALLLGITSLIGGFLSPGTLAAATYYVSPDGNDANQGSQEQPFQTIAKGISVLTAGSTLYIRGGSYAEVIDNTRYAIPSGISFAEPVTIAAYPGEAVTLKGVNVISAQYLIFKDLIVDATGLLEGISITNGDETTTRDNYIRFQNVEARHSNGVFVYSNYNEFLNCKMHDSLGDGRVHGFYILGSHNLLDGCEIYNNTGYGIHLWNENNTTLVHDNILRNNRVHHNGGSSTPGGITINHGDNNIAHDNTVCNNDGESFGVSAADNTQIYNNIIYNNKPGGLQIGRDANNTLVKNNTFILDGIYDLGIGTIFTDNICDVVGPGCVVAGDPLQLQDIIAATGCDSE